MRHHRRASPADPAVPEETVIATNSLISAADVHALGAAQIWDVRGEAAYLEGHWPGAMALDVKRWEILARTEAHALQQTAAWEQEFGRVGIDGSVRALVYDDGRMTEAARVWFILQLHGVNASVIDGGWRALVGQLPPAGPELQVSRAEATTYRRPTGREPLVKLVTRPALRDGLLAEVQVLDARTPAEFSGADLRSNARGGHLPGAKSLPHAGLLDGDGVLRRPDQLRTMLVNADVDWRKAVVTHCDAGGRGALAALAAVAAGHPDVSAYYLSFSDWAADGTCEVALD